MGVSIHRVKTPLIDLMKRILGLIDTLEMGGGAERQMTGLAGMLHQRGLDVTLATIIATIRLMSSNRDMAYVLS